MHQTISSGIDSPGSDKRYWYSAPCSCCQYVCSGLRRNSLHYRGHFYLQVRLNVNCAGMDADHFRPVSDYWTLSFQPQKCINERLHLLFGGIINTLTDFLVFFLPVPTVLSLKIPRRQQFFICLLFGVGFIVCVAGAVRIYFAWAVTSTYDRTWVSYGLWIASVLELDLGIVSPFWKMNTSLLTS